MTVKSLLAFKMEFSINGSFLPDAPAGVVRGRRVERRRGNTFPYSQLYHRIREKTKTNTKLGARIFGRSGRPKAGPTGDPSGCAARTTSAAHQPRSRRAQPAHSPQVTGAPTGPLCERLTALKTVCLVCPSCPPGSSHRTALRTTDRVKNGLSGLPTGLIPPASFFLSPAGRRSAGERKKRCCAEPGRPPTADFSFAHPLDAAKRRSAGGQRKNRATGAQTPMGLDTKPPVTTKTQRKRWAGNYQHAAIKKRTSTRT